MRAVFKSLLVTVCLVVCGWMTTDLIGVLTVTIPMDPEVAKMIQLYAGTFIFTSSAFNAFVYYKMRLVRELLTVTNRIFSRDYRSAMRYMLGVANETHAAKGTTYREQTEGQRSSTNNRVATITQNNTEQPSLYVWQQFLKNWIFGKVNVNMYIHMEHVIRMRNSDKTCDKNLKSENLKAWSLKAEAWSLKF